MSSSGAYSKARLTSCSDPEFHSFMLGVNEELQLMKAPIGQRPLQAISLICRRGEFALALDEPLAKRIDSWFKTEYADGLSVDLSLGYGPVLLHGDLYRMQVPLLMFGGQIVCVPGSPSPGRVPIVNVLDLIEKLSPSRRMSLLNEDCAGLRRTFLSRMDSYSTIMHVLNESGFETAMGDLEAAVATLFGRKPQLGLSRWSCLQAAEKFIKAWLSKKGVRYQHIHDVSKLVKLAEPTGLGTVDAADIVDVQCHAGIRYDDSACHPSECVAAYDAALRICATIAAAVHRGRPRQVQERTLSGPPLTPAEFRNLKPGEWLETHGGLQLQVAGIHQDAPRCVITRVGGGSRATCVLEQDCGSFTRVTPAI